MEKILGTGWYNKLKPFLDSDEFKKIGRTLKDIENITPDFDRTFKAFELCPYEKLKVVMLMNNSYEQAMHGVGLSGKGQYDVLSQVMFQCKEFQDFIDKDFNTTLVKWSRQGVLLLNCDLTSIKGQTRVHLELWKPFIEYIMRMLAQYNTGIIYVTLGKYAERNYRHLINLKQNDLIPLEHPMESIIKKRPWEHQDMFNYINRVSNLINNEKIKW
jgi:uracil-DNA glycosylase